jgi:hypothetical protein
MAAVRRGGLQGRNESDGGEFYSAAQDGKEARREIRRSFYEAIVGLPDDDPLTAAEPGSSTFVTARHEQRKAFKTAVDSVQLDDAEAEALRRGYEYSDWAAVVLASLQTVVTVAVIVWFAFSIYVAATNMYNTRIDYNTNYYDRASCNAHGDHVCQEVQLKRQHAVNLRWVTLSVFTCLLIADVFMVLFIGLMQKLGFARDHDGKLRAKVFGGYNDVITYCGSGVFGSLVQPFIRLGVYSAGQFNLWYTMRHMIWDPVVIVMTFALFAVRYDTKLYLIGVLAFLWNGLQFAAQLQNYRPAAVNMFYRYVQKRNPTDARLKAVLRWFQARWMLPIAQCVLGLFIFSILVVYFAKYPYDSREWYHYFAAIIVLINIGLRSVFNLVRWACYEGRFETTRRYYNTVLGNYMQMSAAICKSLGMVFCVSPFFLQIVFILYDVLYFFVPWAIEHGLDGHSNIARIVFPKVVTYVY